MNILKKLVPIATLMMVFQSCHTIECGDGTVEKNGECVPLSFVQNDGGADFCSPGSHWNPETQKCYIDPSEVCGKGTEVIWSEDGTYFTCESTGGPSLPECPEAQPGGPICITGKIKYFINPSNETQLMTTEITDASLLDQMEIVAYDPLEYASNPSSVEPLGYATIDATLSAFIVTDILVPTQGYVAIVVRDKNWVRDSEAVNWPFTGYAYKARAGENIEGSDAYAIPTTQLEVWETELSDYISCPEGGIYDCGTWIGIYREKESLNPVDGVLPYLGVNTRIPFADLAFIDKDTSGNYNVLTRGSDRAYTSETGMTMYFGAEVTTYFGLCQTSIESLCNEWEMNFPRTTQGGSSTKTLFIEYVNGDRINND